nr:hypothetical protein [Pseudomonas sp. BIGb0427]
MYASLKRNDASLIDVRNHVGGRGILSNISLKDEVVGFFLFVKANQNKEKIVALIGEHNFKDKEHIREFIVHDDNLKALSSALVGVRGWRAMCSQKPPISFTWRSNTIRHFSMMS